ncbi:hypothetical protein ScPMuIL_015225 [Solemya velum]
MHCNKNEFYSHHMKSCVSCPLGEFFHRETQLCKPCSVCPINTISRRQCYGDEDTFCGAFIEFNKFHQSSKNKHLEDSRPVLNEQTTRGSEETVDGHIKLVADGPWYTVAMSLLGVLCFVSVFLAVYVILVCFVCKKKRQEKEIIYDPELCDEGEGPVYTYLQSLLPWRRNKTNSADDISDDSGQGTVSRHVIIMPNGYLQPLDSIDNRVQTTSTASTDYVYFKAPSSATSSQGKRLVAMVDYSAAMLPLLQETSNRPKSRGTFNEALPDVTI